MPVPTIGQQRKMWELWEEAKVVDLAETDGTTNVTLGEAIAGWFAEAVLCLTERQVTPDELPVWVGTLKWFQMVWKHWREVPLAPGSAPTG